MKLKAVSKRQYRQVGGKWVPTLREFDSRPGRRLSKFKRGTNQYATIRKDTGTTYHITEQHLYMAVALLMLAFYGLVMIMSFGRGHYVSPLPHDPAIPVAHAQADELEEVDPIESEAVLFLRRVRILESGNGTNPNPQALHNICKAQNKVNTVGYGGMQGINGELFCFRNAEHEAEVVVRKYRERRATMSEAEVYCVWNLGVKTDTCEYYGKAVTL